MSLHARPTRNEAAVLSVVAVGALAVTSILRAASGGPVATKAFGQVDLLHNGVNIVTNAGLWNPQAVAVDRSVMPNRLYVADAGNHRVLGWRSIKALKNGSPADLVIGQADFLSWRSQCGNAAVNAATLCFPTGIAVGPSSNLYVADFGNNRVLEYDQPFTTDTQPDLVFGQGGSFTSSACNKGGISAATLCGPSAVAVDSAGNAYISDSGNSRALEFDSSPGANPHANLVFGQHGSFRSGNCNAGGVSADSLCRPSAVAVDNAGNLYVGDHDNFRVLEYNAPRPTNNTTADLVFGQNDSFLSNTNSCVTGASAGGLCTPNGLAVDNTGNLYIAGSSFSRVLEYQAPVATGHTSPDAVIGQPGFTASGCNNGGLGGAGLCGPFGMGTDSANDLFVADFANNRVARYANPLETSAAGVSANLVLGQITLTQNGVNRTKPDGLYWPAAVVLDASSSPNHIYLADTNNSRVLGWSSVPKFKYAGPPDLVIGQPDTMAGGCNQNHVDAAGNSLPAANTLCIPDGVAVDPSGNLYVADSGNFRVLEYKTPFNSGTSTDLSANIVFGQRGSFTSRVQNNGGIGAASMAAPDGIALDQFGRLYVADPINNRVLEYNAPAYGNTTADAVFGQGGSFATSACNFNGSCSRAACSTSADALCSPSAVALDQAGRLYIADSANNRVLIFSSPLAPSKAANMVIGQADFSGLNCGTLCGPAGVALDPAGDLFAANTVNSVVNLYNAPLRTGMDPSLVIGHRQCDRAASTNDTLCGVSGLAFDPPDYLYASDTFNNRVVAFDLEATPTATPTSTPTPISTPSATATPSATPTPQPGQPIIEAIQPVIMSGASFDIDGSGFTPGSKVNFFVATAAGTVNTGPLTPSSSSLPSRLTVSVAADNPLGQGVVSVQVVNTDRNFRSSNSLTALLQGNAAAGIPSITGINGAPIASDSINPGVAAANVETVVAQGMLVTVNGAGFDTVNGVAVNLFCACPNGKVGPFLLDPGNPNLTATRAAFVLPASGPDAPPVGPGSFVVVNKSSGASFSRASNAVSVPIGQRITVTSVGQSGKIVTVDGTGFSVLTVINLFAMQGTARVNFGGLTPEGAPKIPLTLIDDTKFNFVLPAAAGPGPAYVEALNPPFTPFTDSGNGPGGSFTIQDPGRAVARFTADARVPPGATMCLGPY